MECQGRVWFTLLTHLFFLRQRRCVNLIASENFAPTPVLEAVGSVMVNKYSEGYPGMDSWGDKKNKTHDLVESECVSLVFVFVAFVRRYGLKYRCNIKRVISWLWSLAWCDLLRLDFFSYILQVNSNKTFVYLQFICNQHVQSNSDESLSVNHPRDRRRPQAEVTCLGRFQTHQFFKMLKLKMFVRWLIYCIPFWKLTWQWK